ncbi:hypothetical protein Hanom_Chr17g01545321 [Helianthus anomalus]
MQRHRRRRRAPIPHPMRRNLSLYPTKPPFVPADDYHRFSSGNDGRRSVSGVDQEAEVLIVYGFDSCNCVRNLRREVRVDV